MPRYKGPGITLFHAVYCRSTLNTAWILLVIVTVILSWQWSETWHQFAPTNFCSPRVKNASRATCGNCQLDLASTINCICALGLHTCPAGIGIEYALPHTLRPLNRRDAVLWVQMDTGRKNCPKRLGIPIGRPVKHPCLNLCKGVCTCSRIANSKIACAVRCQYPGLDWAGRYIHASGLEKIGASELSGTGMK